MYGTGPGGGGAGFPTNMPPPSMFTSEASYVYH